MRVHRFMALLTLLMVVGLVLAACGGVSPPASDQGEAPDSTDTTADEAAAEPTTAPAAESTERIPLEVVMTANTQLPSDDFVKQTIDEALGIDLNLSLYASGDEYNSQLNVRIAAGNPPDLFAVNRVTMSQFAEKGLLLDLTPYMEQLDPTIQFIGEDTLKKGMYQDKLYAIPKGPQIPYNTYWIRKDWLDNLGLQPPATVEEVFAVARAFTEQDPDGNGKPDTYGITGQQLNAFQPIFGAFGVGMPGSFYLKDGAVVNALFDPAMQDALGFIQEMIAAGVVDPDLAANTGVEHRDKAIQGQFGIVYIDWPQLTKSEYVEQIATVNPDAEWIQLPAIEGPGGTSAGSWDIGAAPTMFAIPRALEQQPEKVQKAIDLLNFVSQGDGSLLVQYGVQGRHFNLEDGKVLPTDLMATEANYTWVYQFTGRPELEYLQTKFAPQREYIEFAAAQPRIEVLNGFLIVPPGYNPADADRFIDEQLFNFLYGRRPLSEYEAFLQELDTTYNYKTYRDSAVEQLRALGFGS